MDIAEKEHPGTGEVVSIFLTCVVCGQLDVIEVTRDTELPKKAYWECIRCRERGDGTGER